MPFAAAGQEGKSPAEAKAHQQTITVEPTGGGCSVSLSTKVGKALGTPEGLSPTTLGITGREPLGQCYRLQVRRQSGEQGVPARWSVASRPV